MGFFKKLLSKEDEESKLPAPPPPPPQFGQQADQSTKRAPDAAQKQPATADLPMAPAAKDANVPPRPVLRKPPELAQTEEEQSTAQEKPAVEQKRSQPEKDEAADSKKPSSDTQAPPEDVAPSKLPPAPEPIKTAEPPAPAKPKHSEAVEKKPSTTHPVKESVQKVEKRKSEQQPKKRLEDLQERLEQRTREAFEDTVPHKPVHQSRAKKAATKRTVEQVKKLARDKPVPPFFLADGQTIRSLNELARACHTMNQSTFEHHVRDGKNDFANWVEHVFDDAKLAKRVRTANNPQELARVLSPSHDSLEKHNLMPDVKPVFVPEQKRAMKREAVDRLREHVVALEAERSELHHQLARLRKHVDSDRRQHERLEQELSKKEHLPDHENVFSSPQTHSAPKKASPQPSPQKPPVKEAVKPSPKKAQKKPSPKDLLEQMKVSLLSAKSALRKGSLDAAWQKYEHARELFEAANVKGSRQRTLKNQLHEIYTDIQLAKIA